MTINMINKAISLGKEITLYKVIDSGVQFFRIEWTKNGEYLADEIYQTLSSAQADYDRYSLRYEEVHGLDIEPFTAAEADNALALLSKSFGA